MKKNKTSPKNGFSLFKIGRPKELNPTIKKSKACREHLLPKYTKQARTRREGCEIKFD